MSPKDRARESRSLCRRILEAMDGITGAICAFYPMGDEVDIKTVLGDLLARGHPLYLPRKEGPHFVFRRVTALDTLVPDDFGIPAPSKTDPLLEPAELAIALIPGRAFAANGSRMGRGNGGFDYWIRAQRKAHPQTQFWGVAFECQIVQEVPMEAHDEHVDAILTARGRTTVNR